MSLHRADEIERLELAKLEHMAEFVRLMRLFLENGDPATKELAHVSLKAAKAINAQISEMMG